PCPMTPSPNTHTLSLHDALPISAPVAPHPAAHPLDHARAVAPCSQAVDEGDHLRCESFHGVPRFVDRPRENFRSDGDLGHAVAADRKSTRLNSSHGSISYAVFCL